MAFCPPVLNPSPPPWFVRELRIIDPNLRLVWGYDRYVRNIWVIERKLSPERYQAIYHSILQTGEPRFIEQPVYDDNQPIYDEHGNIQDQKIIGYRKFDLCPEWEWIANIQDEHGKFKVPGNDDLLSLKRQYAWNWTHPISRHKFEEEERLKEEQAKNRLKQERMDMWLEAYDQSLSENGVRVTSKPLSVK